MIGLSDVVGKKPQPSMDEMQAALTLRKSGKRIDISSIGANEAPDLPVKAYSPPGPGQLPIGGVDLSNVPGQQLMPQDPQQAQQGQPGQQPPQGPQAAPQEPQGALQGPQGAPQGPQSNILQMTPQGQAMAAMTPPPQPDQPDGSQPQGMAEGGVAKPAMRALIDANKARFLKPSKVKERLYHATPYEFDQFKPGGIDPELSGHAIWLTPNKEKQPAAHNIKRSPDAPNKILRGDNFTPGTRVLPVYAQAVNPFITTEKNYREQFGKFPGGRSPWFMPKETVDALKAAGYDSVVYKNAAGDLEEVLMFDPNKIKSAISATDYDTSSPLLSKAQGGRTVAQMRLELMKPKAPRSLHSDDLIVEEHKL